MDSSRLHQVYAGRAARLAGSDAYSLGNPAHLFAIQSRQRALLRLLRREGLWPLSGRDILEVGCGSGGVLLEWLSFGAEPERLRGADLLPDRLRETRRMLPHVAVAEADGGRLPYPDRSFDAVLQFTVFSSILDKAACYTVANDMRRVLKPGGLILWYDFWLNPINKQTRGIRPPEIRRLFPDCRISLERITLAPPLARRLVPLSWSGASILEAARLFNTHYLAAIRPNR